jgi:tetratricopeptide (TPR) repeat protein
MKDATRPDPDDALYADFLLIGQELLRVGATAEALQCAARALMIRPDAREALQFCQEARKQINNSEGSPSTSADIIRHLLARKKRLERTHLEQLRMRADRMKVASPNPSASETVHSRQVLSPELRARLAQVRRMADKKSSLRDSPVIERIEALCARHAIRDEDLPTGTSGWFTNLKLSHALHNLGNDFFNAGLYQDARQSYTIALQLDNDLLETYFNRGLASARLELYESALADMDHVLEFRPNLADAHYTRGIVLEELGETNEATEAFMRALSVDESQGSAQKRPQNSTGRQRPELSDTDELNFPPHDN